MIFPPVPRPDKYPMSERTIVIDGLPTRLLEGGDGPVVVLLHSGEFGATAELTWEYNFAALAGSHRVIAPELLGYGGTAKVFDFEDPIGFRLRHLARFLDAMGLDDALLVGSSMSGALLLRDAASEKPVLPIRALVSISGGGPVLDNDAKADLVGFDGSESSMVRLLQALFVDRVWSEDPAYVARRLEAAGVPGAWECAAAARVRAPFRERAADFGAADSTSYERIEVPVLMVTGDQDRLKPDGYGAVMVDAMPDGLLLEIAGSGHLCQVERPEEVNRALLSFLAEHT